MSPFVVYAILIASVTALPANVLPVTLGLLSRAHGLGPRELGYLVAANTAAGLLTSISAPYWVSRFSLRPLAGTLLVVMLASLLGLGYAPTLSILFLMQVLIGVSAVGIASICLGIISAEAQPARAYGYKITADVILAGTFLALVPVGRVDLGTYVALLVLPFVAALLLLRHLVPSSVGDVVPPAVPVGLRHAPRAAWLVLLSMVVFYVAGAGMWPFLERFGVAAGLSQGTAANIIGAGLFVGIAGSMGAVAVAGRVQGIWPQTIAGVLFVLSIPGMALANGVASFAIALFLFNAAWNFFIPFMVALLAARDSTRRLGALVPGTAMLGGIIGPLLAGNLIEAAGYGPAALVMMTICAVSIVLYVRLEQGAWLRTLPPADLARES